MRTGTLNRSFLMPGFVWCTSVGPGTASSSTDRRLPRRFGMWLSTTRRLSRLKYGSPYAVSRNTPCGDHGYVPSMASSASSSAFWSSRLGVRDSRAVAKIVCSVGIFTITPSMETAAGVNAPRSNWTSEG